MRIDDAKMPERECDDTDAVGAPRCGGVGSVQSQAAGCFTLGCRSGLAVAPAEAAQLGEEHFRLVAGGTSGGAGADHDGMEAEHEEEAPRYR